MHLALVAIGRTTSSASKLDGHRPRIAQPIRQLVATASRLNHQYPSLPGGIQCFTFWVPEAQLCQMFLLEWYLPLPPKILSSPKGHPPKGPCLWTKPLNLQSKERQGLMQGTGPRLVKPYFAFSTSVCVLDPSTTL